MNPQVAEVEETKHGLESDTAYIVPEPEPHSEPQKHSDPQTDHQEIIQEPALPTLNPEPVPAHDQEVTDSKPQTEVISDPPAAHLVPNPVTSADEADNTPTSESASPAHTG